MQDLDTFLKVFEPYAKEYFVQKIKLAAKYSLLIVQLYRDLADFNLGGKRMRAYLVWLGYRLGSTNLKDILPICLAVEIFHSFLLIHDDIIDKSDIRHGKPTIHKRYEKKFGKNYGMSQAITLGDIACFDAFDLVLGADFDSRAKIDCQAQLLKVLSETGYGQALDVEFSFKEGKLSDFWQVCDLKTARYSFVGPLLMGGILGGASKRQLALLARYGLLVGKAFQLQDDILGVFGDEDVLGKSTLSDMREGKNTILIHKAKEMATAAQKARIAALWGASGGASEIVEIRQIIKSSGALAWCERENQKLVRMAKLYIDKKTSDSILRQTLVAVADFVASRSK